MSLVPSYVTRLMAGARIMDEWVKDDVREIVSDGSVYQLRQYSFDIIMRIKNEVSRLVAVQGIYPPYSAENILEIIKQAQWVARTELSISPDKLRVLFPYDNDNGCTFYRVLQPSHWLEKTTKSPIHVEVTTYLKLGLALGGDFDAVITPRPSNNMSQLMRDIIACGKVVIYETDDLLTDIPDFNPARMLINANEWHYALIQRAHGRIVSTEQLGDALKIMDNTHVVHNGIDPTRWRMTPPIQPGPEQPVRILWAGGNTHSGDLKMLVDPIRRLIKRYGSRVLFVFVGYMPEEFQDRNNQHVVAQAWQRYVQYAPPVRIWEWPQYLAKAGGHIAIAPLVKHPFNESKSEIKVLEAWALGLPMVASNVAPYKRAITHGIDGFLCGDSAIEWESKLSDLILSPERRAAVGAAGLASLQSKGYLMQDNILNMERAILKICKGKVNRPECELAMEKRLQEIG
jgi:glycosyltransferase involved in cell wall biosynthesis